MEDSLQAETNTRHGDFGRVGSTRYDTNDLVFEPERFKLTYRDGSLNVRVNVRVNVRECDGRMELELAVTDV